MSEKKHTPGPWEIKDGRYIDSPSGWIADVLSYPAYRAATDNDSEEQKANARLIAAAPDLLEALKACELAMDTAALHGLPQELPPTYRDSWADAHIAARAAIAKAESA